MGAFPVASPTVLKAIEAFPLPLKSTRNSLGMRKWLSVSHMKYFWVASGFYAH